MPQISEAPDVRAGPPTTPLATRGKGVAVEKREPWQWPSPLEIAAALDGHFDGAIWKCRCPAHDDPAHSLSVAERDPRPAVCCEAGCGSREIAAALHDRGLWADDGPRKFWRRRPAPAPIDPCETSEYARRLWRVCQPATGTLGEDYLKRLGVSHPIPVAFRFANRLEHWPSGAAYPALICASRDPNGRFTGIQQIFLDGPALAPVSPSKMTVGEPGVIRLSAPRDGALTVVDDVETGLLLLSANPNIAVWATVGPNIQRRMTYPSEIKQINLSQERTQTDRRAAVALTQRLLKEGRDVRWFEPPAPDPATQAGRIGSGQREPSRSRVSAFANE